MTDEELEREVRNLSESLEKLPDSDDLTKQQRRERHLLAEKRATLLRIKEAREKGDKSVEFENIARYGLLTSYGHRHPLLMRLARGKFGTGL